jgi:chorismate mutase
LELAGLYEVTFLYEEKKHCILSLLKLNKILERKGIDDENDISNVLKYTKELPNLQQYWENIQANNHNLKCQNQELEKELQARKRQIAELTEVESMLPHNIDTLQNDIHSLFNERSQLQQFVSRFKNSNEKYLKIRRIAEEVVYRLLTEQESLLDFALKAVIEALRMNPNSYEVIFNNSRYDNNGGVFDKSGNTTSETYQDYYYNKYHEGLVELAKGFLKLLLNQLVDKTMVAVIKET